jgi:uncharacterized membrane protein YfhO
LRGLVIPAGKHRIEFNFKPASYKNGNMAATISSAAIWLLLILAVAGNFRKNKTA